MAIRRELQAELTREKIMETAAEEIYRVGFQATSIGEILRKLGVSKGCFYHHFQTKQQLGYAVLEEMYFKIQAEIWNPILNGNDPLNGIIKLYRDTNKELETERIKHGCPINNLAQEMSPIDEGFRKRVEKIYQTWHKQLTLALKRAQKENTMRSDIDPNEVAALIIAVTQGAVGIAKNAQQPKTFKEYTRGLIHYLEQLRIA